MVHLTYALNALCTNSGTG